MSNLSYGKRMLKSSLGRNKYITSLHQRDDPVQDAKHWISCGLDKDQFSLQYYSDAEGSGIFARTLFKPGDFLLRYSGSLLTHADAKEYQSKYESCDDWYYMSFFNFNGKKMCIDATNDMSLGKLVNDAKENPATSILRVIEHKGAPYLCMFANTIIHPGDEIQYQYGEFSVRRRKKEMLVAETSSYESDDNPFDIDDPSDNPHSESDDNPFDIDDPSDNPHSESDDNPIDIDNPSDNPHRESDDTPIDIDNTSDNPHRESDDNPFDIDDPSDNPHSDFQCNVCNKFFKKRGGLTTHMQSHIIRDKYKKPSRPCLFCGKLQTCLQRHLLAVHKDKDEVRILTNYPKQSVERRAAFENLRKHGLFDYNKDQAELEEPRYQAERSTTKNLMCCSSCKGFYSKLHFYKHKTLCVNTVDTAIIPSALCMQSIQSPQDKEFHSLISSKFQTDEIGVLCKNEPTIQMIGKRLFQKTFRKVDKSMETRKSVMNDMRLLARLFTLFKDAAKEEVNAKDMFSRKNFEALEFAVESVSRSDGKLKHGLKMSMFYLLKSSAKIIIGSHLASREDDAAAEVEKFVQLLDLNQNIIFGDAVYAINFSRQQRLRMPEQQADEDDLIILRKYTLQTIEDIMSQYNFSIDSHEFIKLRDSICCRITLFNARRGGEPSRLKVGNFTDAVNGRWVSPRDVEKVKPWERKLFTDMLITYQTGKGNHLVPVLIPKDCINGMRTLTDPDVRAHVSIAKTNPYIFANTEMSADHVLGWKTIHKMCMNSGVKNPALLTASKQRHRVSTKYCELDLPDQDRHYFYKHMGHTREVNLGTYQYPLPVMEIIKVGRHLTQFDKGHFDSRVVSVVDSENHRLDSNEVNSKISHNCDDSEVPVMSNADKPSTISKDLDNVHKEPGNTKEISHNCVDSEVSVMSNADKPSAISEDLDNVHKEPGNTKEISHNCVDSEVSVMSNADKPSAISEDLDNVHKEPGNTKEKELLQQFIDDSKILCSYQQLRSKIMNEQNKRQRMRKQRITEMMQ